MPFNARAMAHITKQYHSGMLTTWQKLIHHIKCAAYNGYDFYELEPREWQYMDKLAEYGFEITYTENCRNIVQWDNV